MFGKIKENSSLNGLGEMKVFNSFSSKPTLLNVVKV
jgi:hypothetical protein